MTDAPISTPRFHVPDGQGHAELVIKNSVFIGTIARAESSEAAQTFVEAMRELYNDANHNAWAFRITGGPQALIGSSDDGEPGGTAGRPMLAVLEGRDLWQTVAVGTRYFGGTKLGTGGLVRAYGDCVRAALENLSVAEMVFHYRAQISVDYGLYGTLAYLLPRHEVRIEDEAFTDRAELTLGIPYEQKEIVAELLRELTHGQVILADCIQGGDYVKQ